jgi:hypothetical protein
MVLVLTSENVFGGARLTRLPGKVKRRLLGYFMGILAVSRNGSVFGKVNR